MGRASQMAIAANKLAIKDAGLKPKKLEANRTGVIVGTTMGESQVIEQIIKHTLVNKEKLKNLRTLIYPAHAISINVADYFKLKGKNIVFATACAAGNYAVGYSYDLIKSDNLDYVLAGGVDSLSRIAFTGFGRIFAMAPEKCQPFDKDRKGIMLGEGGAILIMESLESAQKRKAHIYAEVLGYSLSCDAHDMTYPDIHGVEKVLRKAMISSGIKSEQVDYISAHGTGTKENDEAECKAVTRVFGKNIKHIPMSSIKSMLGHTMGAASAFETVACCLAIENHEIPPTINLNKQDPNCDIDCVPKRGRKHKVKTALNNSQAFGGNNAVLILSN